MQALMPPTHRLTNTLCLKTTIPTLQPTGGQNRQTPACGVRDGHQDAPEHSTHASNRYTEKRGAEAHHGDIHFPDRPERTFSLYVPLNGFRIVSRLSDDPVARKMSTV